MLLTGASSARRRCDVLANPFDDGLGEGAAQDRGWVDGDLPLVRQHYRFEPHHIVCAAFAGTFDRR